MDIQQHKSYKILLIGDACLDVYHYGICDRISPEAPIPVFKEMSTQVKMGMSKNVKLNLESFGMEVDHLCNSEEIKKHRFIETRHNQQLFRYDTGECKNVSPLADLQAKEYDAVVISDYNKGFITNKSFKLIKEKINSSTPVFVDSKKPDLTIFENCIIKINESESFIAKTHPSQNIIITLGSRGALWKNKIYETEKVNVFDVCGAGDVFLSALVYGYLEYRDIPKSIALANKAASISVTNTGTYVLTKEEIDDIRF